MKVQSTFVKKVGELLASDMNMIKEKTGMFSMIMNILKSIKVLDFCELSQVLFTLHKIAEKQLNYYEDLI